MNALKVNLIIPTSSELVENLLAVRQTVNSSIHLGTAPVIIVQSDGNPSNWYQVPNCDMVVGNVNLNLPVEQIQQPSVSLRSVRSVHPLNTCTSNQKSSRALESTNDNGSKNSSSHSTFIQPSATKILTSAKMATIQKIIESLPKENDSISAEEPKEPVHKRGGKPSKNWRNAMKEIHFKCDICDKEFKKQHLYQKHMHEHSQEKPHHCPKCSASFNVPTNFTLHMATHNIGEPKCPMCNKKFARIASLKAHMVMHEKDENLYCPECDGVFETKSQLEAHMKLHETEKWPSEYFRKCKLCRAKFTLPALYRQHLRDHYKAQTKIEKVTKRGVVKQRIINSCRLCKKSFEKPSQLSRHLRVHTGEKPYKCNLCNRGFTQKGTLKIHMWQHDGNKPYSCSFCPAKFSQKGNLNSHVAKTHVVHEGTTVYRCTHCPCVFKTLGKVNAHIHRVHSAIKQRDNDADNQEEEADEEEEEEAGEEEEEAQAKKNDRDKGDANNAVMDETADPGAVERSVDEDTVCETNKKDALQDQADAGIVKNLKEGYVASSDDDKTVMVTIFDKTAGKDGQYITIKQRTVDNSVFYECSYCDKLFKKPSDLTRHLRIHTREKPFKCEVCDRCFTLKSTLVTHERVHTSEERFKCKICNATWRSQQALADHEKIHTKIYMCQICDKVFSCFKMLKDHAVDHELGKPKRQVSEEVQNLAIKVQLKDPLELKQASNGLLLAEPKHRNDIVNGRGRPHKCSLCPAAFMKLSHLKQHHRKHTGERPFECHVCNRKFTTASALNAHGRIHDCSKPFKCPVCSMNFTTNSSMKRHLVTHTNKRPYMCPYCNKTFKTTVNCRKHIKVHKLEIAEEEMERQKRGEKSAAPFDKINLNDGGITFPVRLEDSLSSKPQAIIEKKDEPYASVLPAAQNVLSIEQNLSIANNPNTDTTQKLLANETGNVTLANYSSGQTFTPENMKVLEETFSQQFLNIDMNLGLNDNNKEIVNQISLDPQNQPILSIIYDGKPYESQISTSPGTNNFVPQLETFDINQITLQTLEHEIGMRITPTTPTSMTSISPNSLQISPNPNADQVSANSNPTIDICLTKNNQTRVNEILIEDSSNLQCHMCKKRDFTADSLKEHLKTHQGDKEFECTYCLSKFCSSGGLSRHMKIHETPETYKCYDCKQEFSSSRELTVHIKEHVRQELEMKNAVGPNETIDVGLKDVNLEKKSNQCSYCSKIFRKPSDLTRHIRTHTGERPYKCPHCEKSFAVKCTLDSHVKVHDGVKQFHCYVCSNVFATKGSLKVHMRLHTGDKPFKCHICDARFRTSGHRKVHMASHTREPGSSARRSSRQKQNSPNSANEVSNESSTVQIMVAPKSLVQNQHQVDNQMIVNDEGQYDSLTIDHTLNTITLNSVTDQITFNTDGAILNDSTNLLNLNDNNQLVANLQYFLTNGLVSSVDIVPENFSDINTSDAQKHMNATSCTMQPNENSQIVFAPETLNSDAGITNINNFDLENCMVLQLDGGEATSSFPDKEKVQNPKQPKTPNIATRRECDVCGKAFSKPCQVERHKRVHTGERPYKCELCDKSFAQKSTLQMHQKHHTGDRPYPCPQCERSFTQSGNLQTHLKRVHKLDPADIKRLTKQQSTNYDVKLSVEDIRTFDFLDFPFDL